MKILICSTRMCVGGAETHVLSLARAFTAAGNQVCVLSSGGVYADKLSEEGIDHRVLPLDKKNPVSVIRSRRAIKKIALKEKFDVVHAHGRIPAFICGTLRHIDAFPPLVVTAHGFYGKSSAHTIFSEWGDRTIAVSEDVKKFLTEKYGLSEKKITVIPNGVDTDIPPHVPAAELRITTASRLDGDTALTALLLCELMPRIRRDFPALRPTLTIAGGGKMLPAIRDTARRVNAGSPGAVTVAGEVTDMPALLARSDIFVGSSRAALEAMSASLPVVLCSDVGCAGVLDERNILRSEQTNFTCRGEDETTPDLLRAAMERVLCASADERQALGRFGRTYVVTRSSSAIVGKRTEDLFRRMIDRRRRGLMLCGYFGCQNAGDEATINAVLPEIRRFAPDIIPVVPAKRKAILPQGVSRIGRFSVLSLIRELKKTRLFVLCGGSLIQNSTSGRSLLYYSLLCFLADRCGAKIMIFGGGIGPVTGPGGCRRACRMLERADIITLRDPDSVTLAGKLGADNSGIILSADAALNTAAEPLDPNRELPKNRYYAVSVRPLRGLRGYDCKSEKTILDGICTAVGMICEKYELIPLWIPFAPEDVPLIKRLSRRLPKGKVLPLLPPEKIVGVLSSCVFSVGLRMHMAVFSSCAGIPAICVSYDPKVASFASYAGHPDAVFITENTDKKDLAKRISSDVDVLLCVLSEVKERISSRAGELRLSAKADIEILEKTYLLK